VQYYNGDCRYAQELPPRAVFLQLLGFIDHSMNAGEKIIDCYNLPRRIIARFERF